MDIRNIAIVGGTGIESLPPEIFAEPIEVATTHGVARVLSVSDNYTEPYKLYFLSRHGEDHSLPPHRINYRANILALRELGVTSVVATNAVGSLRQELGVGTFVVPDDFIDLTRNRPLTLFDETGWSHVDFSQPYSPLLRRLIAEAAVPLDISLVLDGTYVCCDGPRFETPAEIRLYRRFGGDIVGMTGLPEAVFAREAGMEYASICVVTNLAAGLTDQPVDHASVVEQMSSALSSVRRLAMDTAGLLASSYSMYD